MINIQEDVRPLISIVSPCYNEADNIDELYVRIKAAIAPLSNYQFELLFIDNASSDATVEKLKKLISIDPSVKVIVNTRNFGHIRSPYYGIIQSNGVATVYLASDLQDPPEMIPTFIRSWEEGYKLVLAVKPTSETSPIFHFVRKLYYKMLDSISEIDLVENATGFGLYDRIVLDHVRKINDPYPYLRGIFCDLGYQIKTIPFEQPRRARGFSKNNLYTLYDIGILGIVSHSKLPLRLAIFAGVLVGMLSLIIGIIYFILKLIYWDSMSMGIAPLIIGGAFLMGLQFIFLGVLGEYILVMHTRLLNRPIVVEKERINF